MFAVINLLTDPALRAALYEAEAEAAALRGTRWGRRRRGGVRAGAGPLPRPAASWRSRRTLLVAIGVGLAVAAVTHPSAPGRRRRSPVRSPQRPFVRAGPPVSGRPV